MFAENWRGEQIPIRAESLTARRSGPNRVNTCSAEPSESTRPFASGDDRVSFCEPERKNDPVIGQQKRRNGMRTDRGKGTFKVSAAKAEHRLAVTYCPISKLKLNPKKSACPQPNADPPDRA